MISPKEIQSKADKIYCQAVFEWIHGRAEASFPWRVRANLQLSDLPAENIRDIQSLRNNSKEVKGNGYTVLWESRSSRKHGLNDFPIAIEIDSMTDLLQLVGKQKEFQQIADRVRRIRSTLPELESWIAKNWECLIDLDDIEELIQVALYLKTHPRPDCFTREIPLGVPTKLIQNRKQLLSQWLDIILPDESIDCSCSAKHFEQRYGFRYFKKHMLIRVLDPVMQHQLGLIAEELSLPPEAINKLRVDNARIVIVENQVTLLTLPNMERTIAFFGEGRGVTQLFNVDWFHDFPMFYWGDLDVQGFEILAMLRRKYSRTESVLMDLPTIQQYESLATSGTGHSPEVPSELSEAESEAFVYLRNRNLRIEQEHILQCDVNRYFRQAVLSNNTSQ